MEGPKAAGLYSANRGWIASGISKKPWDARAWGIQKTHEKAKATEKNRVKSRPIDVLEKVPICLPSGGWQGRRE